MSNRLPPPLSRDLAAQLLDRAAAIDAAERHDLTALRSAALDAGISPESFDRALAEMVVSIRPPADQRQIDRRRRHVFALKSVLVGAMTGIMAIALASFALGFPSSDAVAGAVVGGGGALAGVLLYLLGATSRESSS
jgi:hypothetical protein